MNSFERKIYFLVKMNDYDKFKILLSNLHFKFLEVKIYLGHEVKNVTIRLSR